MTCEIANRSERSTGVVRDVSPTGLFVQTALAPRADSVVELIFPAEGSQPELRVEAGVARQREVARRLQGAVPCGLGLEIIPPRDEYEKWVYAPVRPRLADSNRARRLAGEPAEESIRAFRFRLTRHDRSASRVLTVRCQTEAGARARALVRVGPGWKISAVQRL